MAKVLMTEELREKMLGFLPMNNQTIKFIPDLFDLVSLTEEEKNILPVVEIRNWNNEEVIRFRQQLLEDYNSLQKKNRKIKDTKEQGIQLIKDAVIDINNLIDISSGELIDYNGEETLKALPEILISNILEKLTKISGFIKPEKQ